MNQLVLIGMPRSGKTTVGEMLAQKLGRTFIDMDRHVSAMFSAPLCQLSQDEARFRSLESQAFQEVIQQRDCVIATGGGTPIYTPHFDKLTSGATVVFLYCQWDVIWNRISQEATVPAFLDRQQPLDSFKELYKARLVHYLHMSHHRIDTTRLTIPEILESIVSLAG